MPQLAEHQLRVAGVGRLIAENWQEKGDARLATQLCLVHDMGNIVKFANLTDPHWRAVQKRYQRKYGNDAHEATKKILEEAGMGKFNPFIDEEAELYFLEAKENELSKANLASVILLYADCRVTPAGVTSYRTRINDLKERYGGSSSPTWYDWTYWFEEWIARQVKIEPEAITEESVRPLFDELLTYEI